MIWGILRKVALNLHRRLAFQSYQFRLLISYKIFEEHNTFTGGTIKVVIHPTVDLSGMPRKEQLAAQHEVEDTIRAGDRAVSLDINCAL